MPYPLNYVRCCHWYSLVRVTLWFGNLVIVRTMIGDLTTKLLKIRYNRKGTCIGKK
jgi:hypothetical protein